MDHRTLVEVARGDRPADVVLRNASLVNTFSGEVHAADLVIAGSRIAALGPGYAGRDEVDLEGRFACPGFLDAHVHVESSLCTPREFARAVLAHGVTSVVADPHEIANVHGLDGIRFMLDEARHGPLSMYVMASSCVPATDLETSGAELDAAALEELRDHPWVLGLAEVMNYPGVIAGDEGVLAKLRAWQGRVVDGHAPGLTGPGLEAYVAAGIGSDHECTTPAELLEKVRRGMTIFVREGTAARNLAPLVPAITPDNARRICLCTDDRHPADLLDEGSIDHLVRRAIDLGIPPVTAIRMATLNPAEHFGLHDRGALGPGRRADLVVFEDLQAPRAQQVWRGGVLVAEEGEVVVPRPGTAVQAPAPHVDVPEGALDLAIPVRGDRIRVIGATEGDLLTEHRVLAPTVDDGQAVADPARDLVKLAVVERHRGTGGIGLGFVQGLGLRRGALASTVAHDHHNLVVAGVDDASMATAARAALADGGGLVAAEGDEVLGRLPLPVAGLMSDQPMPAVRTALDRVIAAARDRLGSPLADPFMVLGFLALEVIPHLKLTDRGLVDVDRFEVVDLWA